MIDRFKNFGRSDQGVEEAEKPPESQEIEQGTRQVQKRSLPPVNLESGLMAVWESTWDRILDYAYKARNESVASDWCDDIADTMAEDTINLIEPHFPEESRILRRKIGIINRRYVGLKRLQKVRGAWMFAISKLFFGRRAKVFSGDDGVGLEGILESPSRDDGEGGPR